MVYVVDRYFVVRFLSGVEVGVVNECRVRRDVAHQARALMSRSCMQNEINEYEDKRMKYGGRDAKP